MTKKVWKEFNQVMEVKKNSEMHSISADEFNDFLLQNVTQLAYRDGNDSVWWKGPVSSVNFHFDDSDCDNIFKRLKATGSASTQGTLGMNCILLSVSSHNYNGTYYGCSIQCLFENSSGSKVITGLSLSSVMMQKFLRGKFSSS